MEGTVYEGKRFAGKRVKKLCLGSSFFFEERVGGGSAVLEILRFFGAQYFLDKPLNCGSASKPG